MPSYLQLLPEDIITHVYRLLYKSILNDMKNDGKYKNMVCFNRLLEISKNPYIDDLNYYDLLVNTCINSIVYKYGKCHLDNISQYNPFYYKSYYIKPLETELNKIEIYNFFIFNLFNKKTSYASNARDASERIDTFNITYFSSKFKDITMRINSNGFILEKEKPFSCLAELLYYTIDLYDFAKQNLYMNIQMIEQIGNILTLSPAKRKEQEDLIDILNYHCNHRYLEGMLYDTEYKCAKPKLE